MGRVFVGSHPLAGSHASGWGAARTALFAGARLYLCRTRDTEPSAAVLAEATVRRGLTSAAPIIEPALFRSREYTAAALALLSLFAGFAVFLFGGALFLQQVWHFSVLEAGIGIAAAPIVSVGFAMNRRTPGGPVDHALPMLRAADDDGTIRAILVNYACHCTTLDPADNLISGDWAGFAQEAIERDHPGAIALTLIGCGADANPESRVRPGAAPRHGRKP